MTRLAKSIKFGGKDVSIPINFVDHIINWWDPERGSARWRSRMQMAISGGYTGADRTRRANQLGSKREMSADVAIIPDLSTLREESQHLYRNNAIAGGAINTNVTKVVGSGLKVKSQIDRSILDISPGAADSWERQAEREYLLATETREIDAERRLPMSLLTGLVFLKVLEDGDLLVNLPRISRPGSPYRLKLQLIEAARICNKDGVADSNSLAAGIQTDDNGAPLAYHVLAAHPNSISRRTMSDMRWEIIKAFAPSGSPLCLHLYDQKRPGQRRGVPYLAPVVELIKQLGRYTEAEVMAAVVTGMLTAFVTKEDGNPSFGPAPTKENPDADPTKQIDTTGLELGYGSVVGLFPGEKIETVSPGRPNTAFDPFMVAVLRQIGMALELPFEVLVKHFTASYSAAQAALEEAWAYFRRRRHWLVTQFCQPIYELVITEAVAAGRLSAPGFFGDPLIRKAWLGASWVGDAQPQIDQLKAINAAAKRVELTVSTLEDESRKFTGTSWEDKLPQILKERAILRANGITISSMESVVASDQSVQVDDSNLDDQPDGSDPGGGAR